jgi:hypothetical protein
MIWNVEITNDGKEKYQSFEARIYVDSFLVGESGYCSGFEIKGWGADEAEARANLNKMLEFKKIIDQ